MMGKVVGALLAIAVWWYALPAHADPKRMAAAEHGTSLVSQKPALSRRLRDRNAGARLGLIVGGTITLGVFYGLPCAGARGLFCVPFAGPALAVAKREREQSRSEDASEDGIVPPVFIYALAGGLGVLQLGGAAMVTIGALLPRRESDVAGRRVTLLPMVSRSAAGVAAFGNW